jgi:hypothetical protein
MVDSNPSYIEETKGRFVDLRVFVDFISTGVTTKFYILVRPMTYPLIFTIESSTPIAKCLSVVLVPEGSDLVYRRGTISQLIPKIMILAYTWRGSRRRRATRTAKRRL